MLRAVLCTNSDPLLATKRTARTKYNQTNGAPPAYQRPRTRGRLPLPTDLGDATVEVEVPASFRVGARQSLGLVALRGVPVLSAPLCLKRLLGVMKPTGR